MTRDPGFRTDVEPGFFPFKDVSEVGAAEGIRGG